MNTHDLNAAQNAERRWTLLLALYEGRWSHVSETVLAAELGDGGIAVSRNELLRDLQYLEGRQLIEVDRAESGSMRGCILAAGVDLVEYSSDDIIGVARPSGNASVATHKLREARWRILAALSIGAPYPTSERTVLRAINDVDLELSEAGLRRECCYLQRLGLLTVEEARDFWLLQLSADGTAVAEYATEAPRGIARPDKYW